MQLIDPPKPLYEVRDYVHRNSPFTATVLPTELTMAVDKIRLVDVNVYDRLGNLAGPYVGGKLGYDLSIDWILVQGHDFASDEPSTVIPPNAEERVAEVYFNPDYKDGKIRIKARKPGIGLFRFFPHFRVFLLDESSVPFPTPKASEDVNPTVYADLLVTVK